MGYLLGQGLQLYSLQDGNGNIPSQVICPEIDPDLRKFALHVLNRCISSLACPIFSIEAVILVQEFPLFCDILQN